MVDYIEEENGFVVPIKNLVVLAACMARIIGYPEQYAEKRRGARRTNEAYFMLDRFVRKLKMVMIQTI